MAVLSHLDVYNYITVSIIKKTGSSTGEVAVTVAFFLNPQQNIKKCMFF